MSTSAARAAVAAPEFLVLPAVWDSQLELFLEALSSPLLLRNLASPPSALGLLKPSVARRRSLEHRAASPPSLALVAPCRSGAGPQLLRKHLSCRWVMLPPAYAWYLSPQGSPPLSASAHLESLLPGLRSANLLALGRRCKTTQGCGGMS